MMKTPRREERLRSFFHLIELYETPPAKDAVSEEGRAFWAAWAESLNALASTCQKDPLMLYLLAAYTDYMIDAGHAIATTGRGLVWSGDTTEVLIRIMDNRVPMTEIFQGIAEAPKHERTALAGAGTVAAMKGGWIG